MSKARTMALCAMTSALCVVLMLLGGILELGMYAAPMLAGLCLIPVGKTCGRKYQTMMWITVSFLSFLLIPQPEQNLLFAGFFGWYPIIRPGLQKLPKVLGLLCKVAIFNASVIAIETLVMYVLVPEAADWLLLSILLVLANVTFLMYDFVIARFDLIMARIMPKKGRKYT